MGDATADDGGGVGGGGGDVTGANDDGAGEGTGANVGDVVAHNVELFVVGGAVVAGTGYRVDVTGPCSGYRPVAGDDDEGADGAGYSVGST